MREVHSAPDLGVEAGGGHRRYTGVIRTRYGGTRARSHRAAWLNKKNKKARALYSTGVFPQATYGGETRGYYPQMVNAVRTMAADVVGTQSHGRCPITAVAIGKGIEWDPWICGPDMVIREAIAAAIKLGTDSVSEVWQTITAHIREATNQWATVKGPLGSLYMHLQEMGWKMGFGLAPRRQLRI